MHKFRYNGIKCRAGIHKFMDWRGITFDWNKARAFLVTAEEGSFSAASRALNMTQPTLGRQVSGLEEELGISLFERTSRGLELTSSGYDLLTHVKAMADAAASLSFSATGRSEIIEGNVCISATELMAAFVLPKIIAKLRKLHPGIKIEIIASNSSSDLLRREADIAIRAYRPTEPELIARRISDEKAHMYAAKSFLKNLKNRTQPESLNDADFLAFDHSDGLISELNSRGFPLTTANFPIIAQSHLVQWELVKQGVGIGFMTEQVGDSEPLVERVLPDYPAFDIECWLVVHRELKTSRRLRLVFDFLAQELISPD